MENFINVSSCMPSYFEIASFSENDIDRMVNPDVRMCSLGTPSQNAYNLRVRLYGSNEPNYNYPLIRNRMLLDGLGDRYTQNGSVAKFSCNEFCTNLNLNGVCTEVYAGNSDRVLEMGIKSTTAPFYEFSDMYGEGFSLSEVMRRVGDIDSLSSSNYSADVNISQRACVTSKCGRNYIVFNFTLKNNGQGVARKILFKNKFNKNIAIDKCNTFLNGYRVKQEDLFLNRNVMKVEVNDLRCGEEANLTVVGGLSNFLPREYNYGMISYVNQLIRSNGETTLDISQKLSNIKIV